MRGAVQTFFPRFINGFYHTWVLLPSLLYCLTGPVPCIAAPTTMQSEHTLTLSVLNLAGHEDGYQSRIPIHGKHFIIDKGVYTQGFTIVAEQSPALSAVAFRVDNTLHKYDIQAPFTMNKALTEVAVTDNEHRVSMAAVELPAGEYQVQIYPFFNINGQPVTGEARRFTLVIVDEERYQLPDVTYAMSWGDECPDYQNDERFYIIQAGEDIQTALNDHGHGKTHFLLEPGVWRLSKPLIPRANLSIYGSVGRKNPADKQSPCVHKTLLMGSIDLTGQFTPVAPGAAAPEVTVSGEGILFYEYPDNETNFHGTGMSSDYVFRHELYKRWAAPNNWACEYRNHRVKGGSVNQQLINPRCADPKVLYINSNRLLQVNQLVDLEAGKFYHDYARRRLYIAQPVNATDLLPAAHIEFAYNYALAVAVKNAKALARKTSQDSNEAEQIAWRAIEEQGPYNSRYNEGVNERSHIISEQRDHWDVHNHYTGNTGVQFHDLAIRYFAASLQNASLPAGTPRQHWQIRNNLLEFNGGAAIAVGPDNIITNNVIRYSGQYGMSGKTAINASVIGNEISHNNTAFACYSAGAKVDKEGRLIADSHCPAGGGNKFSHSYRVTFDGNCALANTGPGFWTDIANKDIAYLNNIAMHNVRSGIYHEISFDARFENNLLQYNQAAQLAINSSGAIANRGLLLRNNYLIDDLAFRQPEKVNAFLHNRNKHPLPAALHLVWGDRGHTVLAKQQTDSGGYLFDYVYTDTEGKTSLRKALRYQAVENRLHNLYVENNRIYSEDQDLYPVEVQIKARKALSDSSTVERYQDYMVDLIGRIKTFLGLADSQYRPVLQFNGNDFHLAGGESHNFSLFRADLAHIDNDTPPGLENSLGYSGLYGSEDFMNGEFRVSNEAFPRLNTTLSWSLGENNHHDQQSYANDTLYFRCATWFEKAKRTER